MKCSTAGVNSLDDLVRNNPLPGRYHVQCKAADDSMAKHQAVILDFEVLAGTVPGQEGRSLREFVSTNGKGAQRVSGFAMALGLIGPNEDRDINFAAEAPGRQCVIEVEESEYEGKTRKRIAYWGFWPLGHPSVQDVPIDKEMAKVSAAWAAVKGRLATTATAPTAEGKSTPNAPQATASEQLPAKDPYADL